MKKKVIIKWENQAQNLLVILNFKTMQQKIQQLEEITNKVKELYQKYEDENIEYLSVEWYTPSN